MLNVGSLFRQQVKQLARTRKPATNRGVEAMRERGRQVERAILAELQGNGPASRQEIADILGLSRVTVSKHVADLIESGEVRALNRYAVEAVR